MTTLTIRIAPEDKERLVHWAASQGKSVTAYLKDLVAEDMAAGTPEQRAQVWLAEHQAALAEEAAKITSSGIPGAALAALSPNFDDEV